MPTHLHAVANYFKAKSKNLEMTQITDLLFWKSFEKLKAMNMSYESYSSCDLKYKALRTLDDVLHASLTEEDLEKLWDLFIGTLSMYTIKTQ